MAIVLDCGGTGLFAGGSLGVGGFGFGVSGTLAGAFFGLNFLGFGVAAICAFCAAACLACAMTADHTLSDINLQSAS